MITLRFNNIDLNYYHSNGRCCAARVCQVQALVMHLFAPNMLSVRTRTQTLLSAIGPTSGLSAMEKGSDLFADKLINSSDPFLFYYSTILSFVFLLFKFFQNVLWIYENDWGGLVPLPACSKVHGCFNILTLLIRRPKPTFCSL